MTRKVRVLSLVGWYLPGYKAGGPLRTIANMVEHLGDEFDFWILTRDRDLGDASAYADVRPDEWQPVGGAMVCYLSPGSCTGHNMTRLISTTPHDVLYLNSFFDPIFTLKPLLSRLLGRLPSSPVVVAPRGEFSSAALRLGYFKKKIFIKLAHLIGLYSDVTWQASSEYESLDIIQLMHADSRDIHVAIDLPTALNNITDPMMSDRTSDDSNVFKLIFLSRISPMKNLDYALNILSRVTSPVSFDIYGPTEDIAYWQYCQTLFDKLPDNVSVNFFGSVKPDQVASIFNRYDLFFFPTRGENFGHVIAESLSVGTPVLLSDQTPWRNLPADRLGWDVSLNDADRFVRIIEEYSGVGLADRSELRRHVKSKFTERLADSLVFETNRELFRRVIMKHTGGLL